MFDSSDSVPNDPGSSPGDSGVPGDLGSPADAGDSGLSGWLESLPVGGAALGELARVDPDALDGAQRVDLLVAWSRQLAHVQAMQTQVVASMAVHDNEPVQVAGGTMRDPVAEEIGCALNISAFAGHLLVDMSRTLVTRLPNILNLVQAGTISWAVAKVVVEEIPATWSGLTDPAPEIEQAMLARVTGRTPAQVRRSAKRVVNRICPADATRRAKTAARGRGVSLFSQPDAMMTVCALLPAADAQYVYTTIDRAARRRVAELKAAAATATAAAGAAGEPIDVPSLDATRADIFLELAIRLAADEAGESTGNGSANSSNTDGTASGTVQTGPKRTVAVVIDALTALGLADNPGHLPGYGPIPASVARELAADATWVRWITDPVTGALLDAGRHKYRPSAALRAFLIARDIYCRFPGCQAQATGVTTEIDHATPFNHTDPQAGGLTTRENLGPICKKHHQYKSGGLWSITTSNPDGSCEWTSPTGRRYYSSPNDILTNEDDQASPDHPVDDQLWPAVLTEPPEPEPDDPESRGPDRWLPHQEPTELEQRLAHALRP